MIDGRLSSTKQPNEHDILMEIQKNGYYIDQVEKTPERCLAAAKQNGLTLKLIPKVFHTPELCFQAIKQNGNAIKYVSKRVLDYQMCMEAVKNDGTTLLDVPDMFHTKEQISTAISI